jgi:hypothetical protein
VRTIPGRAHLAAAAAATLLLAACTDDGGGDAAGIELRAQGGTPIDPTEETDDPATADDTAGTDDDAGSVAAPALVDLTEAVPGTWPVGDAGTVTFSIVDGALVLEDVEAAEGWTSSIDERSPDEIEVDFVRGAVEWEIEIELEDGGATLEIEIDQDVEGADAGSYDLGDAGRFAFEVQDGRLVLTDLSVADGWTVTERDEGAVGIEVELRNGSRRFDVEVELEDDGSVELEIDYEVTGPVRG